ncbi:hypothetical protein [Pseudomonas sp. NPDC089401]|uniref:hypothetical protein n=1 Tax=Pseudomonas sp. NPDC089401 TaxID=3364462 RepID=UPI003800F760
MIMQPRFVVVPAVPVEKDLIPRREPLLSRLVADGFDLYDTQAKMRLCQGFLTRREAEAECVRLNGQWRAE